MVVQNEFSDMTGSNGSIYFGIRSLHINRGCLSQMLIHLHLFLYVSTGLNIAEFRKIRHGSVNPGTHTLPYQPSLVFSTKKSTLPLCRFDKSCGELNSECKPFEKKPLGNSLQIRRRIDGREPERHIEFGFNGVPLLRQTSHIQCPFR